MTTDDRNITRPRRNPSGGQTEATTITQEVMNAPTLPILLFGFAILKDIFDLFDFTLIGIVLTTAFSIFVWSAVAFWLIGKRKAVVSYILNRRKMKTTALIVADFIPFVKIFSGATLFILMIHKAEKQMAEKSQTNAQAVLGSFGSKSSITRRKN